MSSETPPLRDDGLQLREHRSFQDRLWKVQRAAWAAFVALVLMALLGLTGGGGYFSRQTLTLGDATVVLPRVSRWEDSDRIQIRFGAGSGDLLVGTGFGEYFAVDQIQPEPVETVARPDGWLLRFATAGSAPKMVEVGIRASAPGWTSFNVSTDGETETASVLILP